MAERQRGAVRILAVPVAAAILLLAAGLLLRAHPVDLPAVIALNQAHTGAWAVLADGVYRVFSPLVAVALTAALTLVIWWATRRFRVAAAFAATVALIWVPTAVAKLIVDRPRPVEALLAHPHLPWPTDSSFPSGHTAFAAALSFAAWFLVRERARVRLAVGAGGIGLTLCVAAAVVSDGIHYPTDALASIVWACAMAPAAHWLAAGVLFRVRSTPAAAGAAHQAGVPIR